MMSGQALARPCAEDRREVGRGRSDQAPRLFYLDQPMR
jgi:hypothetical protein